MWREIKCYQRDSLSSCARVDLEFTFALVDQALGSPEDARNEWIDSESELEALALHYLKQWIKSQSWLANLEAPAVTSNLEGLYG